MNHGSLFSGIGGFDLASRWMGWNNIFQVEWDEYCQQVLEKNFPETLRYKNVHNFTVDKYSNLLYICEKGEVIMGRTKSRKYDNATTLYESGMSIQDCADFYGITRQAMHMILKRRGCKFRDNLKYGEANHFHRGEGVTTKKRRVQHITHKAIQSGRLIPPVYCEVCGGTQTFKDGRNGIQAHHDDYDKPLEVRWLCQKCHHNWHKENKPLNSEDEKPDKGTSRIDVLSGGFP